MRYTAPSNLTTLAAEMTTAGWVAALEMMGAGRFAVLVDIPFDDDVTHLLITEAEDDGAEFTVGAYTAEGSDPVWLEDFKSTPVLLASALYWNDSVSSATEPMMELTEDWS
jgi:hypothetical protein